MKRKAPLIISVLGSLGLLFWDARLSLALMGVIAVFVVYRSGVVSMMRKRLAQADQPAAPTSNTGLYFPEAPEGTTVSNEIDPTMITQIARAPHELLGVDKDAGTTMIFQTYFKLVKDAQNDHLRLNKNGRRLEAAKKTMLSRRRKLTGKVG